MHVVVKHPRNGLHAIQQASSKLSRTTQHLPSNTHAAYICTRILVCTQTGSPTHLHGLSSRWYVMSLIGKASDY